MMFSCRPKRKHLILTDFIEACLEEDTLLDEDCKYCVDMASLLADAFVQLLVLRLPSALQAYTQLCFFVYLSQSHNLEQMEHNLLA